MAEELIGMNIAVLVVTISIILSGLLIGFGRALSIKRIELFGFEELVQSIINGALVGAAQLIISSIQLVSSDLVEPECSGGDMVQELMCTFQNLSQSLYSFSQELIIFTNTLGYYQSLVLDFGSFAIQPLNNLSATTSILTTHLWLSNILLIILEFNIQILSFFSNNALALLFPLGLVFRSFFATRKLGGFLIALAIGLYIFYPTFILIFPSPVEAVTNSTIILEQFNNNTNYSTVPILDLNNNSAIAGKFDKMSVNNTFMNNVTVISQASTETVSRVSFYSIFSPLFSLLITVVFIMELGRILGGEMSFPVGVV